MIEIVVGTGVGCLVAVGAVVRRLRRPRTELGGSVTLPVQVRARSADEALVKLAVEATVHLSPGSSPETLRTARAAVEDDLRQCLASRRLLALPGVGDSLPSSTSAPDVRIESMLVVTADVEVTRELRRLVGGP